MDKANITFQHRKTGAEVTLDTATGEWSDGGKRAVSTDYRTGWRYIKVDGLTYAEKDSTKEERESRKDTTREPQVRGGHHTAKARDLCTEMSLFNELVRMRDPDTAAARFESAGAVVNRLSEQLEAARATLDNLRAIYERAQAMTAEEFESAAARAAAAQAEFDAAKRGAAKVDKEAAAMIAEIARRLQAAGMSPEQATATARERVGALLA